MYNKYDIYSLRQMYRKYDISPSTRDIQELDYLAVYEMSTGNRLRRRQQQKYKNCNILPTTRDVQEITNLAVCDKNTTRNKTDKERAEKQLTM